MSDYLSDFMPKSWIDSINDFSDFKHLPIDSVTLKDFDIEQAQELSCRADNEERWQFYLNVLALYSFEHYLRQRTSDILLNKEQCIILQSPSDTSAAVCNLQANGFKLCLIVVESIFDEMVYFPSAVLNSPDLTSHFYIPIEIYEEQKQVIIRGFLQYEQLLKEQQSFSAQLQLNSPYHLPLDRFESNLTPLLRKLSCLEPSTIVLTRVADESAKGSTNMSLSVQLSRLHQTFIQPVVDVSLWLHHQFDEFAKEITWRTLPSLAMRYSSKESEILFKQLVRNGLKIPSGAQGAYRDVQVGSTPFRLYVLTWTMQENKQKISCKPSSSASEWSLLLILGSQPIPDLQLSKPNLQPSKHLPQGTKLKVSDLTEVLVESTLKPETQDDYLIVQVVGTFEEQFLVSIIAPDNTTLTLPPFAFHVNA